MRQGRILKLGLLLCLLLLLTGCGLLPEEKQYSRVPLVREYTSPDYSLAYVQRGELAITESVSCKYVPVRDSSLSFGISGIYYEAIYVSEGDVVRAGDLLASLELGTLPQEILNGENQLRVLELQKAQLMEQQALAIRQQRAALETMTPQQRAAAESIPELEARYGEQIARVEDAIYLQRLQLEALEDQRARRELRADMDGTVTYVRKIKTGDRSVDGNLFVKIADLSHSVFVATTERWDAFAPGDIVTITSRRVEYEAMVTDPGALGLAATANPDEKKRSVYFSLTAPAPELEDGDSGSTVLTLDYRADTLYLDKKAVHRVNEDYIVYYQDPETGIRSFKNVTIGMEASRYSEILSGLEEGESVILK